MVGVDFKYKHFIFLIMGMVVMNRFFPGKIRRSRICITVS